MNSNEQTFYESLYIINFSKKKYTSSSNPRSSCSLLSLDMSLTKLLTIVSIFELLKLGGKAGPKSSSSSSVSLYSVANDFLLLISLSSD